MKKKILLVSSAFYPEISPRSFRATELAKEFARQGHTVTVISKFRDFDYSSFLNENTVVIKMLKKCRFPNFIILKKQPFLYLGHVISRVLQILFEYPDIIEMFQVKGALKHEQGYDLAISFAVPYPVHWGVAWSRNRNHLIANTWVADCGDPFMGDQLDSFRKPFYFSYLEKMFCRKADFVTIPVESATPGYFKEFHPKIRIIPQGFNFSLSEKEVEVGNRIPEFAYAGRFIKGVRDPKMLMEALIKINTPFRFYVYTDSAGLLNEYRALLNGKLIVSEFIEREELMVRLSKMNFLINFDNGTSLNVPSKLIDYSIINLPVLNVDKNFKPEFLQKFFLGDFSLRMMLPNPKTYHITNVSNQFLSIQ